MLRLKFLQNIHVKRLVSLLIKLGKPFMRAKMVVPALDARPLVEQFKKTLWNHLYHPLLLIYIDGS